MNDRDRQAMIGKWAVCGGGRIGKIERVGNRGLGHCYFGTGLSGHPWESASPQLLAPSNQVMLDVLTGERDER